MSIIVDAFKIRDLVTQIFEKSGLQPTEAAIVADNLVQAEMRGVRSHGLVQVANYSEKMRSGLINCHAHITQIAEGPATLAFDADFAPGAVAGKYAMAQTIARAKETGVSVTTVKNGRHFGFAAYYAMDALSENMIGFSFTSSSLLVAPFGGYERVLGTNPICIAVPADKERPIVFDAATSNAAYNKSFFAYTEGRAIPDDWVVDKNGNPTTDPADIVVNGGALLPFGGYKGYGLDFMVYILTTILSGASIGTNADGSVFEDTKKIGYNFAAIDISRFTDVEAFKKVTDLSIQRLKNSKKKPGVETIFVPGEIEYNLHDKAEKEGLLLYDGVSSEITRTITALGITTSLTDCAFTPQ